MSAPINQIQSPDDEDEDQTEERHDVVYDCQNKDSAIKEPVQGSFLSYYNHSFGQAQDLACFGAVSTASNPLKISYERLMKEGFDLASPKMKANKRKAEVVDGGGGGGGRVVRATGRKDRHSKVRTARGPRDRRVRLSPRTAIQFYDVQDRLGYDRPSKAIDWLINEAKTAIDALEGQPLSDSNAAENQSLNHGGFSVSQRGMREKQEHWNDDSLGSGFNYFGDAAALEAYLNQDLRSPRNRSENIYPNSQHGLCSDLNGETNWEMGKLQKVFSWDCGNENSGSIGGAEPISGHLNLLSQREPLQSSVINNEFAAFNFSNELSKIAASATDQNSNNLLFTMPSTTPHYQGYH